MRENARGGYMGRLLRVDLSDGRIAEEVPPPRVLRRYLGGLGLGATIVYDGVPATSSSDWTVTTLRREIEDRFIYGSHSHGYRGAYLETAGCDGIVVQGAASCT